MVERSRIGVVGAGVWSNIDRCGRCRLGSVGQGRCGNLHGSLSGRDARTSCQVLPERLAGSAVALLRKEPDRRAGGMDSDTAGVRLFEAGDQPQERRLAHPVGPDDRHP